MKRYFLHLSILIVLLLTACAPEVTPPAVDVAGTMAVEMASVMLTQTVAAYSPTPPPPTLTLTPAATETPTLVPPPAATTMPKVTGKSPCYTGPGPSYTLTSYISDYKDVVMVGVGSVPGWYVIVNPYFRSQCWIAAENLVLDASFDISTYPTITP